MQTDLSRSPLVHILAGMTDLRRRTLGEHGPDSDGHCLSCRRQGVRVRWPCAVWEIGSAAESAAAAGPPSVPPHPVTRPSTLPRHRLR